MQLFLVNELDFILSFRYCVILINTFNVFIQNILAQYVNWYKHPVPVLPSSRLINMNNNTQA